MEQVSVIVPIFNAEQTLKRCIDSILNQTYTNLDICLIDDSSNDASLSICEEYVKQDDRVRIFHTNGGASVARNKGIEEATGQYLMFCDSDDFVEKDWCDKLLKLQSDNRNSLVFCNFSIFNSSTTRINRESLCKLLPDMIDKGDLFQLYEYQLINTPWNKIYDKGTIDKYSIRFREDISLGEDLIFNLKYSEYKTANFRFIHEPLYNYQSGSSESLTNKYLPNLKMCYDIVFNEVWKKLKKDRNAMIKYKKNFFQSLFWAYEKVLRNTWSSDNEIKWMDKYKYNMQLYKSDRFKKAKKYISYKNINILQWIALKTDKYAFYFMAEKISSVISSISNCLDS